MFHDMGLSSRKPVLRVVDQVRLKPAFSATEISKNILEILHGASWTLVNNNGADQSDLANAQAGICLCCFVCNKVRVSCD